MAANKRTQYQINKDKKLIIKLLDGGQHSHAEIAEKINKRYELEGIDIQLSRSQITSDIKNILEEMDEDLLKEARLLVPLQTRRYLWVYSEAQEAWIRSKKPKSKTTIIERVEKGSVNKELSSYGDDKKYSTGFDQTTEVEEQRDGDPRFLVIIDKALSKIDRLNGLYIKESVGDDDEDEDEDEEETFETDIPDNERD